MLEQVAVTPKIRRTRRWLRQLPGFLLKLSIAVAITLIIIELGARVIFNRLIAAHMKQIAADPTDIYNLYQPDPELGWIHKPGAIVTVTGEAPEEPPYTITISSKGLYDEEYDYKRHPNGFRVLVLGDSFAEAVQEPLQKRSFEMLEQKYRAESQSPYEIVEMGVARYSPGQYYQIYMREGRRYHADVIIVMIFLGNDVPELHPHTGYNSIIGLADRNNDFTLEDGKLVDVPIKRWHPPSGSSHVDAPVPFIRALDIFLFENLRTYYLMTGDFRLSQRAVDLGIAGGHIARANQFETGYTDPFYAQAWPIFKALILTMRDTAEADGSQFAVVLAPEMYSVYPDLYFEDNPAAQAYRDLFDAHKMERQVSGFLDESGITYLDLTPDFEAAAKESKALLYWRSNQHWNAAGHRAATQALDKWFQEMGWSPKQ